MRENISVIILILIITINSMAYGQDSIFKPGHLDSLNQKQGYFLNYLDENLIHCDSAENASFQYYAWYVDDKVLSLYRFPRFHTDYKFLERSEFIKSDTVTTLNDTMTFRTEKGMQYQFIFKEGYLIREVRRFPSNRPTLYIPSFKVEENIIVDIEELYFNESYKDYKPSFYYKYNNEGKKIVSKYFYHNGKKWKRSKKEVEKLILP